MDPRRSRLLRSVAPLLALVAVSLVVVAHLDRAQARGGDAPGGDAAPATARIHSTHLPDPPATGAVTPRERPGVAPGLVIGLAYGDELPRMDEEMLASALDDAASMGATVRLDVSWADVQHDGPEVWDWSGLDRVVGAAAARGLGMIGVLAYTPAWARPDGCAGEKCRPASEEAFAAFAAAAAARYRERIGIWEIWNEQNSTAFWAPVPDVAGYARLLEASAAAVRAVDPAATVLAGGLAAVPGEGGSITAPDFLRELCALGGQRLVDGVAYHPYTYPLLPSDRPEGFATAWNAIRDTPGGLREILAAHGAPAMPIWLTEFGAPTGGPGTGSDGSPESIDETTTHVTEARQAEIARDSVAAAEADPGIAALVWYSGRDRRVPVGSGEDFYGLRRADGVAKPALAALREAAAGRDRLSAPR